MAKKRVTKTKRIPQQRKDVTHYLQIYVLTIAIGLVAFLAGNLFVKPQVPCANSKSCNTDLTMQINNEATGTFEGHTIVPPKIDIANDTNHAVLGSSTPEGDKHIYVDLTSQTLYAMQGSTQIMQTFISSGKWKPTPVGNFSIWEKLRATRMAGGEGADAYDLPNVPYVMYFYQDFGLHGAYWHNNFGHPMSHGCVNERIVDARDLYNWAEVGTPVSVCNSFTAPNNCVQKNPVN